MYAVSQCLHEFVANVVFVLLVRICLCRFMWAVTHLVKKPQMHKIIYIQPICAG